MKKNCFSFLILFFLNFLFWGQEIQFRYNGGRNYTLVERTDLRRYENNRYVGLLSREIRSFISNYGDLYEGSFYVSQDTVRASLSVADQIHDSIPSKFRISDDGNLTMIEDYGYPTFRSFPAFSANRIKHGDSWQAKAERAVDPLNKGIVTKIPMYVQYTYTGDENVRGEDVYVLTAKWATRYGQNIYMDFGGDKELKQAMGSHNATMYVSKVTGNAIVVRDSVDETFVYNDGNAVTFKGTISLFTEYPPAVDRSKIIRALQRVAAIDGDEAKLLAQVATKTDGAQSKAGSKDTDVAKISSGSQSSRDAQSTAYSQSKSGSQKSASSKPSAESISKAVAAVSKSLSDQAIEAASKPIKVENTTAGIRLTIQNLQFKPDSAELVSGESSRLDQIASVLREVPESQFLVEGHTAATGNETGEMRLSALRAHKIAKELSKRGIPQEKFICKGSGAHKPVADNSTPAGKAVNRRVEITILE
ncbi:MAG: OmpA family protein [Spirochaetia bacterium]|nr:OmpA family protein [Spirochaetia bacterium]